MRIPASGAAEPEPLMQLTETHVTFGEQTYELATITGVRVRQVTDRARRNRWLLISFAVLMAWSLVFAVWIYPLGDVRFILLAVVPLAWLFITDRWAKMVDYVLTLDTLFGAVDLVASKDKEHIRRMFHRIDEAVRKRNWL
jgi:hypothetical protein